MLLREFDPHPALKSFVQHYRICHFEFGTASQVPVKAYAPKPEVILHFFLRDFWAIDGIRQPKLRFASMALVGQRTSIVNQFTGSNFLNVQIVFQPTAIFKLTRVPSHELTDQHLDPVPILGNDLRETLTRLQDTTVYVEMLSILEQYCFGLMKRLNTNVHQIDKLSEWMMRTGGNISLAALADKSCLCKKQFKRRFHESIGVNPKLYSRIIRFNKVYNMRNAYPGRDWLTIAIESGYHDYQHLVKDYKEFTGTTPTSFHLIEGRSPESILGLTPSLYKRRAASYIH